MAKIKQEDGKYIDAPNAKTKIQLLTKTSDTSLDNIQLDLGEPLVNTKDKTLIIGTATDKAADDDSTIVLGNGRNVITDNGDNTITLEHFDGNSSTARSAQTISMNGGALSEDEDGNISINTQYTIEAADESNNGAKLTLKGAGNATSSSISITTKGAKTVADATNIEIDTTHNISATIDQDRNSLTISHNDGETQTNVNILGSDTIKLAGKDGKARLTANIAPQDMVFSGDKQTAIGQFSPIDQALLPNLAANRFADIDPSNVRVYYKRDHFYGILYQVSGEAFTDTQNGFKIKVTITYSDGDTEEPNGYIYKAPYYNGIALKKSVEKITFNSIPGSVEVLTLYIRTTPKDSNLRDKQIFKLEKSYVQDSLKGSLKSFSANAAGKDPTQHDNDDEDLTIIELIKPVGNVDEYWSATLTSNTEDSIITIPSSGSKWKNAEAEDADGFIKDQVTATKKSRLFNEAFYSLANCGLNPTDVPNGYRCLRNDELAIVIDNLQEGIYTFLNRLYMWVNTGGCSNATVDIYGLTRGATGYDTWYDTWSKKPTSESFESFHIYKTGKFIDISYADIGRYDEDTNTSGWKPIAEGIKIGGDSGFSVANIDQTYIVGKGGGNADFISYLVLRFKADPLVSSRHGLSVGSIYAAGGVQWTGNLMSRRGVPYYVENETTVFDYTSTLQLGNSGKAIIKGIDQGIELGNLVASKIIANEADLPKAGTETFGVVKVGDNLSVSDGIISGNYKTATGSQAGLMSSSDKAKLEGIANEANNYSLPAAGAALGGVKSGGDVNILDGIITVNDLNGKLDKIGTDNIIIKDVGDDKFKYLEFRYSNDNNDSESECSWRLGYDGTGSGNMNYFRIQSTKSSGTAAFTDALRIGMDNHDFVVEGPITATTVNGATIASTSFNGATITSAGAITAGKSGSYQRVTAGSFNAMSDARLKENFQPLALEKSILDLPIYRFDFIGGAKNQIGCKAQDLQEICPEIVNEGSDGYLSIQESKIVYLLLEEVKKLKREIADLKRG